ncbi:MAG TPA: hypothetical protein PKD55_10750 [Bellilinea sp.]|nr:hypothetical protein [Bellilinea sp.]
MHTISDFLRYLWGDTGPIVKATGFYNGWHEPTRQKRGRKPDRQSHNQSESKVRRLMAAKSNRINRQRCRRWKH